MADMHKLYSHALVCLWITKFFMNLAGHLEEMGKQVIITYSDDLTYITEDEFKWWQCHKSHYIQPWLCCSFWEFICDRILQNPTYGTCAQLAQCAFLVPQVKNCQTSNFVVAMSKNLSSNCCHRLRRLGVSYQGEISLYLQAPRSTWSVQLPCTEPVAMGIN